LKGVSHSPYHLVNLSLTNHRSDQIKTHPFFASELYLDTLELDRWVRYTPALRQLDRWVGYTPATSTTGSLGWIHASTLTTGSLGWIHASYFDNWTLDTWTTGFSLSLTVSQLPSPSLSLSADSILRAPSLFFDHLHHLSFRRQYTSSCNSSVLAGSPLRQAGQMFNW